MAIGAQKIVTAIIPTFIIGAVTGFVTASRYGFNRRLAASVICGIQYALTAARFGVTWHCAHMCILFTLLNSAALSDLDTTEIPDIIHIAAAGVFLVFLPLEGDMLRTLIRGLLGALSVGGAMFFISWFAERMTEREAIGGGDIKLFAVLGLHFGIIGGIFAVIASCVVGLVVCALKRISKSLPFPFAPSIAIGAFVTAMAGEELINLYLCMFR